MKQQPSKSAERRRHRTPKEKARIPQRARTQGALVDGVCSNAWALLRQLAPLEVRGLASWGWRRVSRRLVSDRQAKYGHGLELVETFVDRSRFPGGAYAASNWLEVGLTQGRRRGDRERRIQVPKKAVYVYPLSSQARQRLCR